MKRFLWLIVYGAASGLITSPAYALPCVPGTLSEYLALDAAGCTIGQASFAGFAVEPFPGDAVDLAPELITLTPDGIGFILNAPEPVVAGPGQLFGLRLLFGVENPRGMLGGTIALGESVVAPDGVNTALLDADVFGNAIAFDIGDGISDRMASFGGGPSGFFDIFVEIAIDGGIAGRAMLGPTLGRFSFAVPEPPALLLWALALFLMQRRTRS